MLTAGSGSALLSLVIDPFVSMQRGLESTGNDGFLHNPVLLKHRLLSLSVHRGVVDRYGYFRLQLPVH